MTSAVETIDAPEGDRRHSKLRFLALHAKSQRTLPAEKLFSDLQGKRGLVCNLETDPEGFVTDQELSEIVRSTLAGEGATEEVSEEAEWLRLYPDNPRNIIRGCADYINETSFRLQPAFALAAGACMTGVLAGRKFRDEWNNRTNLYAICVGKSGSGKDRPRQAIKHLLSLAGLDGLIGPDGLNSGEGFVTALEQQPALLFCIDEAGKFFRAMADPNQNWMVKVGTNWMTAYSSANQIWSPNAFSDAKKNKTIDQPNAVILATTVPQSLFESFTPENLSDGLVGRFLFFRSDTVPKKLRPVIGDPPAWLIDAVRKMGHFDPNAGDLRQKHPQPIIIPATDEAKGLLLAFDDECEALSARLDESSGAAVWRRAAESVGKLALIHACGERLQEPEIDAASVKWAAAVVRHVTGRLLQTCGLWISENQQERKLNAVLRVIADAGPNGITKSELTRKTQYLTKRERGEILDDLIESRRIVRIVRTTATKPAELFRLVC